MSKKLFKNYEFEFDKNELKVLTSFCKQAIKQMNGDERFLRDVKTFDSIINKLETQTDKVKFTKEEKTKLVFQLKENSKYLQKEINKSWFIKKWFYRNMFNQYNNIINKHFTD